MEVGDEIRNVSVAYGADGEENGDGYGQYDDDGVLGRRGYGFKGDEESGNGNGSGGGSGVYDGGPGRGTTSMKIGTGF